MHSKDVQNTAELTSVNPDELTPDLANVFAEVAAIAKYHQSHVLLLGETGVGKSTIAKLIHDESPLAGKPYETEYMGNITDPTFAKTLLFGHAKGAFTGAVSAHKGLFDLADGGTLFLDEIADMPPEVQNQLLQVLDTGIVKPLGQEKGHKVDVRLITATSKNLEHYVREGKFRADLYYRLNELDILVPALNERPNDVGKLAIHFVNDYAKKHGLPSKTLDVTALESLKEYGDWKGNVRELKNVVHRCYVLADKNRQDTIDDACLQEVLRRMQQGAFMSLAGRFDQAEVQVTHKVKLLDVANGSVAAYNNDQDLMDAVVLAGNFPALERIENEALARIAAHAIAENDFGISRVAEEIGFSDTKLREFVKTYFAISNTQKETLRNAITNHISEVGAHEKVVSTLCAMGNKKAVQNVMDGSRRLLLQVALRQHDFVKKRTAEYLGFNEKVFLDRLNKFDLQNWFDNEHRVFVSELYDVCQGNVNKMADRISVDSRSVYGYLDKYGIKRAEGGMSADLN